MIPRSVAARALRRHACRINTTTTAPSASIASRTTQIRCISTSPSLRAIRQAPDSDSVSFPGAVRSKFTSNLAFQSAEKLPAIPTYRVLNADGAFVNPEYSAESIGMTEELAVKLYEAMVKTNTMDRIMYDSQRQGRISFYMVSQGEEAITVGSAAAIEDGDKVFAQYREQGNLMFRGFTLDEFMNQLFATTEDYGKGRAMPVHYQSEKLGFV